TAALLALAVLFLGPLAIRALTDLPHVRAAASAYLPYSALYVLLSVAAFQLDGVFIGATATRTMRNAALVSAATFIAAGTLLVERLHNQGLWLAFVGYVVVRALTLLAGFPGLRRAVRARGV